jgi:hypothetical protein
MIDLIFAYTRSSIFLMTLITLFIVSCNDDSKKETSTPSLTLNNYKKMLSFSSGSGMLYYNNFFYLVGDDDPRLGRVDSVGKLQQYWEIWDVSKLKNGRIRKNVKPDFEAMSIFPHNDDSLFLIFGSGSVSPQRDVILAVHPKSKAVDTLSGQQFFSWLKSAVSLSTSEINIEGAAYHNETLYLFNRHNNEMYSIPHDEFETFITTGKTDELSLKKHRFELPVYKTDTARFSGATAIPLHNMILFSASIETTDNWKDDGAILGSYIGLIYLDSLEQNQLICLPVTYDDETLFQGKIEALHGFTSKKDELTIYFITDDDDGTTGWGKATLKL